MRFEEALTLLKQGKKIRRSDWTKGYYITIINEILAVFDPIESEYCYTELHSDDFLSDDWEVVE